MAKEEKRLIGEYKVINSMFIGSKEVALCENLKDPHGLYYMTCDVHNNDFYEFYNNVYKNEDYIMVVKNYADRIEGEIEKLVDSYI